jgi:hypothetical protein
MDRNTFSASRRPVYTVDRYRADLAALDALRASEAPGVRETLAAAVIGDADLDAPPASGVRVRRDTLPGVAVPPVISDRWAVTAVVLRELTGPELPPVTPAVLRAAGLTPRPTARGGAR